MKNLLFILILTLLIPKVGKGQNELESLKIKLEIPISLSDSIVSASEIEKEPIHILTYYLSPFYKKEFAIKELDSTDSRTKVQVKFSNKSGHLCDLLNNCEDGYYSGNEKMRILDINTFYSEQIKDYYVLIIPDKNTSLEDIEKLTEVFLNSKNIGKIYFAFTNKIGKTNYFHFAPKKNFNIHTNKFNTYKDWVNGSFKIIYGEALFFTE